MDTMEAEIATLYELLGRRWTVGAPVTDVAFDAEGEAVAFALADGALAIASLDDAEPPQDRCRIALDEGRATISPRRKPVPPLMRVMVSDAPVHVASLGMSGFVASDHGRLVRVSASGITQVAASDGPSIDLVAPAEVGGIVVTSGETITFHDSDGGVGWRQPRLGDSVSGIAVSRDGRCVAIGIDGRLLVRTSGPQPETIATIATGPVATLSWSPDGSWLAASVVKAGVVLLRLADLRLVRIPGYPATVSSLSWSADSRFLVTGGGYRIVAWDVAGLEGDSELPMNILTGRAGFVLVHTVDMHPERSMVAAGYDDGRVVVARIGAPDELVVKPPGRGAVTALRWSRDGKHLALGSSGTGDGDAAIVTFPRHVFK